MMGFTNSAYLLIVAAAKIIARGAGRNLSALPTCSGGRVRGSLRVAQGSILRTEVHGARP